MIPVAFFLVVIGLVALVGTIVVGPLLWSPAAFALFALGCLLWGLGLVRDSINEAARHIIAALPRVIPAGSDPAAKGDGPLPTVEPTPHPAQRRPTFEELTAVAPAGAPGLPPEAAARLQNCPACGTVNIRSNRRCKKCGTSL